MVLAFRQNKPDKYILSIFLYIAARHIQISTGLDCSDISAEDHASPPTKGEPLVLRQFVVTTSEALSPISAAVVRRGNAGRSVE
jgi:hypothetical protein